MAEDYLDTNNNSNAVNKMMTRLMNATASLHSSSNSSVNSSNSHHHHNNNNGSSGEATALIVATAAAGSTVNESAAAGAASSSSSSSLTSLIKVSGTLSVRLLSPDVLSTFTFRSGIHSYYIYAILLSFSLSVCPPPIFSVQVSPLKSLLREDLKRRINARASNRASRNNTNNNNHNGNSTNSRASPSPTSGMGCNSTNNNNNGPGGSDSTGLMGTTSNGVITSTGPESDLIALNRKRNLQCLFCGIEFPDQTLYFLHKGCHSESNPWKCNICGEQMNNVYEFNSHLLSKSHQ